MMISISLPLLMGYSLAVSVALIWLNLRGAGILAAAGGTLVVCVAIALMQSVAGAVSVTRQAVQYWGLFVLTPSAAVFAVSRVALLQERPWSLLFLGPLTFLVAVTIVMVSYNVLFASARSQ